ncbi:YesK-like family protein [Rummeliibacillus sp. G93]|uniref:YesK family protein n=1 Tax=Rummeliibacillus TaxID=648802 RepID=UPI00116F83E8|nr:MULTISPECIES: YesK family protein [Rummeliibacillus]MBB5171057.1 glucan phosphoethanolaminetransferase (alkaline phosphatase superfamily) [Rummeliibacillus stabekisii]UQW96741.1 YesK-like family protein [Rummeliibacillus sp. G93]GEL05288.1 hypothetical protein RST01_19150 [Rummeliibacillus stabekisii]
MSTLMLAGWTPILVLGILFLMVVYFIAHKVSRKTLYSVSIILSLICIGLVIYSIYFVRGWDGLGYLFTAVSILAGTWIGTLMGLFNTKKQAY